MLRPFEVLLHKPAIASHAGALGATIRFESELADEDREVLILAGSMSTDLVVATGDDDCGGFLTSLLDRGFAKSIERHAREPVP